MARVAVSADRLRAVLAIDAGEALDLARLKELLVSAGIHHGLRKETLSAAAVAQPAARVLELASGSPPTAPVVGTLELVAGLAPPVAVTAGQLVAQRAGRVAPKAGIGVDGQPIPAPPMAAAAPGPGLAEDAEGRVTARWYGRLVRDDAGGLRVDLPDGKPPRAVEVPAVAVAADGSTASIALEPGEYVEPEALVAALTRVGVVPAAIDRPGLTAVRQPTTVGRTVVVARTVPPVDGVDAVLDYVLETAAPASGNAHERIDWHHVHGIVEVPAGAELIRMTPATAGTPGTTATGKVLPAKPGRNRDLGPLHGDGTRVRTEPPAVVSAIVGAYRRDEKGVVSVQCPVIVDGDLDIANGDVDTTLPVVVRGDVLQGATLRSGAAISITGSIEDARVGAGGDLVVGAGILAGRHPVAARARILARHVVGRRLRAQAILVENGLLDSEAVSETEVRAKAIIGGRVLAGAKVVCDTLGDLAEARTHVLLGVDASLAALADHAAEDAVAARRDEVHLRERVDFLRHLLKEELAGGCGLEEAAPLAVELREAEDRLSVVRDAIAHCERIIARRDNVRADEAARIADARLVVRKAVHAGVTIAFGDCWVLDIREQLGPSTFRIVDGALVRE